ncbi:MAG: hypothetical protein K5897_01310 [Eubacterium sp.]|nr:hypothetical protein [Eubacterium sp.]
MSKKEKIILFGSIAAIIVISAVIILVAKLTKSDDSGTSAGNEPSTQLFTFTQASTEDLTESTTGNVTESTTEPQTDASTETTETETTEDTQVNTEEVTEQAKNVQQPPKAEAVQLFSNILDTEQDTLDASMIYSDGGVCATADVNGDGMEDLIMLPQVDDYGTKDLYIYGYDAEIGSYKILYQEQAFVAQAGGGTRYSLFTRESNGMLYLYRSSGDESWTYSWSRFDALPDGTLTTTELASWTSGPDGDSYTYKGKKGSKKQYDNTVKVLSHDVHAVVMYNDIVDNVFFNVTHYVPLWGKSYNQLKEQLRWELAVANAPVVNELPDGIPQALWLSNGNDDWGGMAYIGKDGAFSGSFHMNEYYEGTRDYGTLYEGEITGNFQEIRKLDDYTYALIVGESTEGYLEKKSYEDGNFTHEPTRCRGLGGGRIYLLFLPGHPTDTLPEEFLYWAFDANDKNSERQKATLEIWGLYNVDTEYGMHE